MSSDALQTDADVFRFPCTTAARGVKRIPLNDTSRMFAANAEALEEALLLTARSGQWLDGASVEGFAQRFRAYLGVRHVIPVANGTDALELALRALLAVRRPPGREVVTVANAGGYTVTACRQAGLTPVFVDIDESTQLVDPAAVLETLGPGTAAVVVTHLYGGIVDVPGLRSVMDAAGHAHVAILEDCAQAHGAHVGGRACGTLGDIAAYSFYPTKNLGAMGDAGAVVTSDDELAALVRGLHQYGWSRKYEIGAAGGRNSRMDELQAAVLSTLLEHLDAWNARRQAIHAAYQRAAGGDVRFVSRAAGSVVHLAVALCARRDAFRRHLGERLIATDIHYPVLDCDQPGWVGLPQRTGPRGLPCSRRSVGSIVTLPCFPWLTDEEVARVTEAIGSWSRQ